MDLSSSLSSSPTSPVSQPEKRRSTPTTTTTLPQKPKLIRPPTITITCPEPPRSNSASPAPQPPHTFTIYTPGTPTLKPSKTRSRSGPYSHTVPRAEPVSQADARAALAARLPGNRLPRHVGTRTTYVDCESKCASLTPAPGYFITQADLARVVEYDTTYGRDHFKSVGARGPCERCQPWARRLHAVTALLGYRSKN